MSGRAILTLFCVAIAARAIAQTPSMDHSSMPGMDMKKTPGHDMGSMPEAEIPETPPPAPPSDAAADQVFDKGLMATARAQLRREHGGGAVPYSKIMASLAEYQFRDGSDGTRWDGRAWFGGDINRVAFKSEGESDSSGVQSAEFQALYSRAVGVYTDFQMGVRQDFEPRGRTYATVGFETLLPYWFEVEGAAFVSDGAELLGRIEGTYDLRLSNRLILQPRAEINLAAQNRPRSEYGSGISNIELGFRLRYDVRREFSPYIGISWDRKLGNTADYASALGEDIEAKSIVLGIRGFF